MSRWLPLHRQLFGLLLYPARADADDAVEGRIRAEQISNIKRYLSLMMLANACNALVLVAALWNSPQRIFAASWAFAILIFAAYHGARNLRSTRAKPSYASTSAVIRAIRNALVLGSLWAMLPLLFFPHVMAGGRLIITCLCAGMLGGGAFAFASIPAAAIAFTTPIVIGSAIAIGRSGDTEYFLVALLMISYIAVLLRGAFVHAAQISTRIIAQVQAERKVRRDELTDLPNRLAFYEGLESAFARLGRLREQFSVLYFDLNDFKSVNDKLGHATGDRLLIYAGQRLKACVRDVDLVSRLSGDEFAVIVANSGGSGTAMTLANRIVGAFDAPFLIDGVEVFAGASIGIAVAPMDGTQPDSLLKSADEALYAAKHGAGGAVQLYDPEYKEKTRRRRSMERDLRSALRRCELFLVFQPIMSLCTNRVAGNEALLRWRHPELGVRSPIEFINVSEETGLIHEIGNWVIYQACKTAASWPKDTRIAVNVSANQLRTAGLLSCIVNALTESNLRPGRLELEITETALIDQSEPVLANLRALRDLGVRIALDDFGTGHSSLTYLRKLSPDSIKIEGSFVRDMLTDPGCASIVKSVISLSRDLRINVVAEGIESPEQLSFIRNCGCNEGQGYFFCRPASANEVVEFMSSRNASHHVA